MANKNIDQTKQQTIDNSTSGVGGPGATASSGAAASSAGTVFKGLEGVIAAESSICKIDGQKGKLYYLGYSISELTEHCSFEEVVYLLLFGELPNSKQLSEFQQRMRRQRGLNPQVREMVRNFPAESHPMELLQAVIAYLSGSVRHRIHHSDSCNCRDTLHQVAQLATVVASLHRYRHNLDYIEPRTDLSHGANLLYMMRGEEPDELEGDIMDKCLIIHAEHSFNASTFTARVVASTLSTCYCSIAAAIGALYGRLHGGANEHVMAMVDDIGEPERARVWVTDALAQGRKIMGMGHRVYRTIDPRAIVMEDYLKQLSEKYNDFSYYRILKEVETTMREHMDKKGKKIYPNVDFFSGAVYRLMKIPAVLYTPLFAVARVAGWLAHILEQRVGNRIYRPKASYVGQDPRAVQPLHQRT